MNHEFIQQVGMYFSLHLYDIVTNHQAINPKYFEKLRMK